MRSIAQRFDGFSIGSNELTRLLAIQAGPDARVPLSIGAAFVPPVLDGLTSALKGLRIGWLGNLSGHLAQEPRIAALCEQALLRCEGEGAQVETLMKPGFDANAVWQAWLVWRRALMAPPSSTPTVVSP